MRAGRGRSCAGRWGVWWVLGAVLLGGCAGTPRWSAEPGIGTLPGRAEIVGVPHFPQQQDQCGPAALATVLGYRGIEVTPEQLRSLIYLPEKGGTLRVELVARARRYGMLAYPLAPRMTDLLTELQAGNPVLVMQNLGLDWWPRWHFAVAIGYDLEQGSLLLRSGPDARYEMPLELFDKTWWRADRWAVVISPPQRLPASAEPRPLLQAANALELVGEVAAAHSAYTAALARWPGQPLAWLGQGNSAFAQQDYSGARHAFLQVTALRPDWPAGWNNLAYSLLRQACSQAAMTAVSCAVALAPDAPAYRDSLQEISALSRQPEQSAQTCPLLRCPVADNRNPGETPYD